MTAKECRVFTIGKTANFYLGTVFKKEKNMALTDDILRILASQAASRTHFSFSTTTTPLITVNSTTFTGVANYIRSGRITVGDATATTPNGGGSYTPETDTMAFRPGPGGFGRRRWQASVIHEAVHASFDANQRQFSNVDQELASYLAEAVYLVRTGLPVERWIGMQTLHAPAMTAISAGSPTTQQIEAIRTRILGMAYGTEYSLSCHCNSREALLRVQSYTADGIHQ
jgi:hypothetical protein